MHQHLSKNQWKEFKNNEFLQKFAKKCEKIDELFLKYWGLSGAKACKSCRSRQELSNEDFLAKFGVDTEENEPYKVCSFDWKIRQRIDIEPFNQGVDPLAEVRRRKDHAQVPSSDRDLEVERHHPAWGRQPMFVLTSFSNCWLIQNCWQTLKGLFSAVSTPIFASKN